MYVKSIITICMVFYSILAIPQNENKIINGVSKENFRWGDDIGNGAGLSESNFAFAFHNMETILKNILSNSEAGLSHLELDLTSKIIQSLKDEYNKNSRVYFVNKNQYPFSDKPECYNKVACTGLKVGSFIFLNR